MLVDEFMRENPAIHVRIVHVPQNYIQKLQIMVAGGTAPDVFFLPDADFPAFVVKKTMMPLDGFIQKSAVIRTKDFWPTALTRYSYDGRRLGRGTLYALRRTSARSPCSTTRTSSERPDSPTPPPPRP